LLESQNAVLVQMVNDSEEKSEKILREYIDLKENWVKSSETIEISHKKTCKEYEDKILNLSRELVQISHRYNNLLQYSEI
jgi:hypothetical protein